MSVRPQNVSDGKENDDSLYKNRYFVFRGKEGWPMAAEAGDTVHLALYEYLEDRNVDIDVDLDYALPHTHEQKVLQGYATLDNVKYRVTVNLYRRHVYSTCAVLVPHA